MVADRSDSSPSATSQEIDRLTKKADHLSDFGTLTSLVSTAAYFIESTVVKKLPKWVGVTTLSAVGVGIASVLASYYYKFKAGRVAVSAEENMPARSPARHAILPPESEAVERSASCGQPAKPWLQKAAERGALASEPQR